MFNATLRTQLRANPAKRVQLRAAVASDQMLENLVLGGIGLVCGGSLIGWAIAFVHGLLTQGVNI